jgi:hypothetical protein
MRTITYTKHNIVAYKIIGLWQIKNLMQIFDKDLISLKRKFLMGNSSLLNAKFIAIRQTSEVRGRPSMAFFDFRSAIDSCDHALLFLDKLNRARIPAAIGNTHYQASICNKHTKIFADRCSLPIRRGFLSAGPLQLLYR